jgi:hypothetical protein
MVRGPSPRNTNTAATERSPESNCELRTAEVHGKGGDGVACERMPVSRSACLNCGRTDQLGFADETRRQNRYGIAVAMMCPCQLEIVSKVMQGSVPPGTRRHALLTIDRESSLSYAHEDPDGKPMLWVADAVAWCSGAGGTWRGRIAPILYR